MTSPPLSDQKARIDEVDELRALGAELRALAERLELKARSHDLQPTLNALEQRLSGPRAVVMLASEHEDLKRRFLERLLGPNLAQVPKPMTVCMRLEYGAAPESIQQVPQAIDTIRLLHPALKSGLAIIDTPALENGEPDTSVLKCAKDADACIFVLDADHKLSESGQALLRELPEGGARLEIVIENAEARSGEDRLASRERLVEMLRDCCKIEAPRLTLVASDGTEDDGASFWHGRFATFHSVMMRRGREHWLKVTRTMVADALAQVSVEIEFELKSGTPGQRHARLRQGMKVLEWLRTRFAEMQPRDGMRAAKSEPSDAIPAEDLSHRNGNGNVRAGAGEPSGASGAAMALAPATMPENAAAIEAEGTAANETGLAEGEPIAILNSQVKRGLSTHFKEKMARWRQRGEAIPLQRTAGIALGAALICLIVWALSPRGFLFGPEEGAEWDYRPPAPTRTNQPASSTRSDAHSDLPKPGGASLPETSHPAVPNIPVTQPAKRSAAVRMPLARPIPSGGTAGVAPRTKRHHRHLLGLGRLWHWVRHDHNRAHHKDTSSAE
jgi:hypothetical protein